VGGSRKNLGTKRGSTKAEKRARLQLVDVFITMDSGGVFVFALASEEDEEEEAAEEEETEQGTSHSNQTGLIRSESIIITVVISVILVTGVVVITTVVIIRSIITLSIVVISAVSIRIGDETVTV